MYMSDESNAFNIRDDLFCSKCGQEYTAAGTLRHVSVNVLLPAHCVMQDHAGGTSEWSQVAILFKKCSSEISSTDGIGFFDSWQKISYTLTYYLFRTFTVTTRHTSKSVSFRSKARNPDIQYLAVSIQCSALFECEVINYLRFSQ